VCGKQTLPLLILGKSRMRKRARTDLCGGRSAMVVPTATAILLPPPNQTIGTGTVRFQGNLPPLWLGCVARLRYLIQAKKSPQNSLPELIIID
jgi:hypothetical protein